MADPIGTIRFQWPRVVARATSPWEVEFARKIAESLKRADWKPTEAQLATIKSMCRAFDAETPEPGEVRVMNDGSRRVYLGHYVGWGRDYTYE